MGLKSATMKLLVLYAYGYLRSERKGTHRLVRISPFNTNDGRPVSLEWN